MLPLILLGVGFVVTLIALFWLYAKLTPKNIPDNLAGFFAGALWFIGITVGLIYSVLFAFQLFFG